MPDPVNNVDGSSFKTSGARLTIAWPRSLKNSKYELRISCAFIRGNYTNLAIKKPPLGGQEVAFGAYDFGGGLHIEGCSLHKAGAAQTTGRS